MSLDTTLPTDRGPDPTVGPDDTAAIGFLHAPKPTPESQRMFDEDVADGGYVMNATRLWAYQPATMTGLFDLIRQATFADRLSLRHRGILIAACASTLGDSYCSLVWGSRLATATDARTAAAVLRGDDDGLDTGERLMADWARKIACDPNTTTAEDVQKLRAAGFTDAQIFTITVFVTLRLAFSTVNDALGLAPDGALRATAPVTVLDTVTFGRAIEEE